jgi:DNA replication protein DnaC
MVQTLINEKCTQQLHNIPLSNNTVSQWIAVISEDLVEQLIEKLRHKSFLVQTDEATDCSGIGLLIAYM